MGRNLLGTDSLEEGSHVVVVSEHEGVLLRVVRVDVTLTHAVELIRVVTLSVFLGVLGLGNRWTL
jgi:hypothetical protein